MHLLQFLRTELAQRPGRLEDSLRIVVFTVLVVILTETFQTPLPAYSAYIVFFISKEERASTILTGMIGALSVTLAVFLALAIYIISVGEAGLRLPLMVLVVFIGMLFSRISTLGLAAFAVGFLVTLSLTIIDFLPHVSSVPTAQELTKSVLWLWAIIMLPVAIVILGNILFGRDPADLFYQGLKDRLEVAYRFLTAPNSDSNDRKKIVTYAQAGTGELLKYLKVAGLFKTKPLKREGLSPVVVAHVGRLMTLMAEWTMVKTPSRLAAAASECGALLMAIAHSLKEKNPVFQKVTSFPCVEDSDSERKEAILLATIIETAQALSQTLAEPVESRIEKPLHQLFVPDAFSNPEYVRYALKTTLAIFIAYITYNMLDWPGIRTCLITCFFVALGTVGETVQKMILRLTGAMIGGILGLGTVIFAMPHLTTITGLSVVVAVITFFAAWIALSSEWLSYAGLQIALAFFLCILIGYSPQIELTPARDRVIGVLFGNLIIFVIFSLIWPTRAVIKARHSLSEALDILSQMYASEQKTQDTLFFAFNDAISRARSFASLDPFESLSKRSRTERIDIKWVTAVQALSGPTLLLISNTDQSQFRQSMSQYLAHIAARVKENKEDLPLLSMESLGHETAPVDLSAPVWPLACADWYGILNTRLNELAILLKQATYEDQFQLNSGIRETSETL